MENNVNIQYLEDLLLLNIKDVLDALKIINGDEAIDVIRREEIKYKDLKDMISSLRNLVSSYKKLYQGVELSENVLTVNKRIDDALVERIDALNISLNNYKICFSVISLVEEESRIEAIKLYVFKELSEFWDNYDFKKSLSEDRSGKPLVEELWNGPKNIGIANCQDSQKMIDSIFKKVLSLIDSEIEEYSIEDLKSLSWDLFVMEKYEKFNKWIEDKKIQADTEIGIQRS